MDRSVHYPCLVSSIRWTLQCSTKVATKLGIREKLGNFANFLQTGKLKFLALKKFNIISTSHLHRFGILLTIKIASIVSIINSNLHYVINWSFKKIFNDFQIKIKIQQISKYHWKSWKSCGIFGWGICDNPDEILQIFSANLFITNDTVNDLLIDLYYIHR